MGPFKYGAAYLAIQGYSGRILDQQKGIETHVTSSGGGGYLHQGTGYVSAPTVSSYNVTRHEFWVELTDGTQHPIQLRGLDIPLSVGQNVTLAYGADKKGDTQLALLVNHAAKQYWQITGSPALLHLAGEKTPLYLAGVIAATGVLWAVVSLPVAIAVGVVATVAVIWRRMRVNAAFEQYLKQLGEFVLSKG